MASQVLTDCKLYVASFDMSGDTNALALEYGVETKDGTTFGNTTRINKAGLKSIVASCEGLWDSDGTDEPSDVYFSRVGTSQIPVTICPTTGADGEVAFLFRAVQAQYEPGAQVGELFAFNVSMEGSDGAPLVRGFVLHPTTTARTSTGNGTARQIGAVSATQTAYGALHVIAASGTNPTLDVTVRSDDGSGFGSPTTRLTFAQKTAIGSDWQTADGAITDDWWRVTYTIGGTDPSFTFVVAIGIA
jgi:hypothetical protein